MAAPAYLDRQAYLDRIAGHHRNATRPQDVEEILKANGIDYLTEYLRPERTIIVTEWDNLGLAIESLRGNQNGWDHIGLGPFLAPNGKSVTILEISDYDQAQIDQARRDRQDATLRSHLDPEYLAEE